MDRSCERRKPGTRYRSSPCGVGRVRFTPSKPPGFLLPPYFYCFGKNAFLCHRLLCKYIQTNTDMKNEPLCLPRS